MAAAQTFSPAGDPRNQILRSFNSDISHRCNMGSVSSLIEKHDFSPDDFQLDFKPLPDSHSPGNILKRSLNQRELLSYLSITKKDGKSAKKMPSGLGFRREHSMEEENQYPGMYQKEHRSKDFTKTSLPERGRFEKSHFGPSALKPSNGKNFMSMQSLCSSSGHKLSKSNGSLNTLGSLNSPPHRGPHKSTNGSSVNHQESESEENDSLSDSRHNSVNSFSGYSPGFSVARGQISASTGHINHIGGSLDRASRASQNVSPGEKVPLSCKSMATLSRLQCSGEPPPPYEYSQSVEDVARQLEEKLHEKGMELRQLRRNLSDKDDPFTQVFEDKRRLWMEELDELKQMYVSKLQQISQQALRSQRALQLQLYKVQQEKKRLHEELSSMREECEQLRQKQSTPPENLSPKLEESKWEISQKAGEISLLKRHLKDSQAEVTQKMGEIFLMKTQLREAKGLAREKEKESTDLKTRLQAFEDAKEKLSPASSMDTHGSMETVDIERLRAELMLERRQNEAQMLSFEHERKIWKEEKEKVLRYQKEIQASYLEMFYRNQALEKQVQEVRQLPVQSPSTPSLWMDAMESFETT